MNPNGHAAVVTGAASGLGAESAAQLAGAGAKVALLDVNLDAARDRRGGAASRGPPLKEWEGSRSVRASPG